MAGETKTLGFSEGVTVSAPTQSFIRSSSLVLYANDAAYVTAKGSAAEEGDEYGNTTDNKIHYYDGTSWTVVENSQNNFAAAVAPDANDDSTGGYSVGSKWIDTTADEAYICADATAAAAVWLQISPGAIPNKSFVAKTGAYTVLAGDDFLTGDATGGAFSFTLPAAASNSGKHYFFAKIDSSANAITIDGNGGELIDGVVTITLDSKWQSVQIISNGTSWFTVHGRHQINSLLRVATGNGYGSTNNKIRRFSTTITNVNNGCWTYADSATAGMSVTINEPGLYVISYVDIRGGAPENHGVSLNSTQLTTTITAITQADRLLSVTTAAPSAEANACVPVVLAAGDVIRAHGDGTADGTVECSFTMTKLGRV